MNSDVTKQTATPAKHNKEKKNPTKTNISINT